MSIRKSKYFQNGSRVQSPRRTEVDMLAKDLRESCGEGASYNTVLSNEGMVPDDVGIV